MNTHMHAYIQYIGARIQTYQSNLTHTPTHTHTHMQRQIFTAVNRFFWYQREVFWCHPIAWSV